MNNKILEQFKLLSISDGAGKLFPILAQNNNGLTVLQLSKILNLPRSTIYGYVDELLSSGFIKKGIREESSLYYAESKETIIQIFNERIHSLKKAQKNIDSLWKQDEKTFYKPKFYTYEGNEAYQSIFRDILSSKASSINWYWPMKSMLDVVSEEHLQEFHRSRIRKNMNLRVLWPKSKKISDKKFSDLFLGNEAYNKREIRLLPKGLDQNMGYGIYGTKVAFISSDSEQYAFVVDSRDLSETLRNQFEYIWKLSEKRKK